MPWQRACALTDLQEGEAKALKIGDEHIGIYLHQGKLYALSDICTHEFALLSGGFVDGSIIECPLHGACFEIVTGKCLGPMAREDLKKYEVRVEEGEVWIDL